ncbi:MAG: hypothetical protein AB8B73_12455 [Ekhidna sp.]
MYKLFLIGVITLFIVLYSIFSVTIGDWLGIVIGMLYPVLLIAIWFPQMKKSIGRMKELSYDEENLYVMEKGYEIQIPFHQVKYIEILSLDGLYKFTLYHHDQFGDEVTCKPSIWYPLNYKRVDKELNRIRTLVRKAHKNYKEQIENNKSLASFN